MKLNETSSPLTAFSAVVGLSLMTAALICLAVQETDGLLRVMYLLFAAVMALLLIAALVIIRRYRCIMDDEGAQLGKNRIRWADVRTAAVIRRGSLPLFLTRFPEERYFILLSIHVPQAAVDKHHFQLETPQPGVELRIPVTASRRRAIEHYLGMTLPEYNL